MQQKAGYPFTIRDFQFYYDPLTKLFTCNSLSVATVLKTQYLPVYNELCLQYPDIATIPIQTTEPKTENTSTPEGKSKEKKKSTAQPPKHGIMVKIKKGIRSIIERITPKKLRKRIFVSDDE